ncbi:hypothetical protein HanRHA438_Chr15g0723551 [Helianthus annuus]|nr:hypothetical protein HanHA89_Chr15g0629741 [Helianthus annuus]KAJ0653783.1 hypothetical protein HanOQP8_Chr15g0587461 [Helianthus annuus]KAJ0846322.1 hypothetical protein HanRHA438_Chr15g0723551 [Helianthus annuus]
MIFELVRPMGNVVPNSMLTLAKKFNRNYPLMRLMDDFRYGTYLNMDQVININILYGKFFCSFGIFCYQS